MSGDTLGRMVEEWRRRLADYATQRRSELGRPLGLKGWGGPSDTVMARIEKAEGPAPRGDTFAKLDAGLEWVSGSAQGIKDGRAPVRLEDAAAQRKEGVAGALVDATNEQLLAEVARRISVADALMSVPPASMFGLAADDRDPRESDEYDGDDPA